MLAGNQPIKPCRLQPRFYELQLTAAHLILLPRPCQAAGGIPPPGRPPAAGTARPLAPPRDGQAAGAPPTPPPLRLSPASLRPGGRGRVGPPGPLWPPTRFLRLLLPRDPPPRPRPRQRLPPLPPVPEPAPQAPRAARPRTPRGRRRGRRHFRRAPPGGRKHPWCSRRCGGRRLPIAAMPKKKAARPLRELCVENVAANMQLVWAKDYVERSPDDQRSRHQPGPFSDLAGCLVRELIDFLGLNQRMTRPVLPLLLVPQLTELDLSRCSQLVTKDVAQIISSRCKNLSALYLQGCSRIPSNALVDLIKSLPSLKKLDLSDTRCNTQVLSAVGSTCQHLSELNISDCKRMSPDSLFHLAYDVTASSFSCQGLQLLFVDYLEPSDNSRDLIWALAFVLLALPSLQFLENEFVSEALQEIFSQQFAVAQVDPRFPSLEELSRRRMAMRVDQAGSRLTLPLKEILEVDEAFLPMVCAVCPQLTKATVLLFDGSALSPTFYTWRTLTNLTLDCSGPRNLVELLPVAAAIGAQMQFLSVDGFYVKEELSFHTLLNRCPNLHKFTASIFLFLRGEGGPPLEQEAVLTPPRFSHLTEFTLSLCHLHTSEPSQPIPRFRANLLSVLQNSPCLESVELFSLPFGLDEVFEKVLEPRGAALVNLTYLSLLGCQISSSTIHLLLAADNQLHFLHLDKCPDICRGDYDELLRKVSQERLDLQIEWQ